MKETIVIRPLKRRDNRGRKVRGFPIFNTKKTAMPYAYQYLKEFNNGGDIQDIDIESMHADLDLSKFTLDYMQFLVDYQAKEAYMSKKWLKLVKILGNMRKYDRIFTR